MRVVPDLQGDVFAPLVMPELVERAKRVRESAYGMSVTPIEKIAYDGPRFPTCLCPKCGMGHPRFIPD